MKRVLTLVALAGARARHHLVFLMATVLLAAIADVVAVASLGRIASRIAGEGAQLALPIEHFVYFILAALTGSGLRLAAVHLSAATQAEMFTNLCASSFERLQRQSYTAHLAAGGAETFALLEKVQAVVGQAINPLINSLASALAALMLSAALVALLPTEVLPLVAGFALATGTLWLLAHTGRKYRPQLDLPRLSRRRMQIVYAARVGFRDIFLCNAQARVAREFADNEGELRGLQAQVMRVAQSPRWVLEILVLLGCTAFLVLVALGPGDFVRWLPALAMSTFALLRIIPGLGALHAALSHVRAARGLFDEVIDGIGSPDDVDAPTENIEVQLREAIALSGVSLSFPGRGEILRHVNLTIRKGARIAIVGPSGSGKSSLLDLICGAQPASDGVITLDGVSLASPNLGHAWRRRIGFVSQAVFLPGATIGEAICFPRPLSESNSERLARAIDVACLRDTISTLPEGLETQIGDGGVTLSGGQRQRVSLARALYHARDLLILDEATGQLDQATELLVIERLRELDPDLTVIIASHSPAPLRLCDEIYRLSDGELLPNGQLGLSLQGSGAATDLHAEPEFQSSNPLCIDPIADVL